MSPISRANDVAMRVRKEGLEPGVPGKEDAHLCPPILTSGDEVTSPHAVTMRVLAGRSGTVGVGPHERQPARCLCSSLFCWSVIKWAEKYSVTSK